MAKPSIEVIYDGDCPFCTSYVRMVRLRKEAGPVALIDARSVHPRVGEMRAKGYDLDVGMIVLHAGNVFHGDAAIQHLSVLTAPGGLLNNAMRRFFQSPRRARIFYPLLVMGRRLALRLLGRQTIADAARENRGSAE